MEQPDGDEVKHGIVDTETNPLRGELQVGRETAEEFNGGADGDDAEDLWFFHSGVCGVGQKISSQAETKHVKSDVQPRDMQLDKIGKAAARADCTNIDCLTMDYSWDTTQATRMQKTETTAFFVGTPVPDAKQSTVTVSATKVPIGTTLEIHFSLRGARGNPMVSPQALSSLDLQIEKPGGRLTGLGLPNQLSSEGKCVVRNNMKDVGPHKIHAKVCSSHMTYSPVTVVVTVEGKLINTYKPPMNQPHDVIKHQNDFVVTDKGNNQVQVFDTEFRPANKFCSPEMPDFGKFDPFAVAWTGRTFVVTDIANHCVVEFSNFVPTQVFGQETLQQPRGIAVARNGNVYVSDGLKHSIVVFDKHRECISILGGQGTALGRMNTPWFIAINSHQHLVVAEFMNRRIQVWNTHNNTALQLIDVSYNGKKWYCRGLTVDHHDNIYVTVRSGFMLGFSVETVLVYSPTGEFLGNFGEGFNYVKGLTVTQEGQKTMAYVVDGANHRIKAYEM